MENATKALLIAAAVLIAILVISLGIVVYNMASETIGAVDFSGQEVQAFNDQFSHYEGDYVRGSEVNAMIKTVLDSNMKSRAEGLTPAASGESPKFVSISGIGRDGKGTLTVTETSIGTDKVDTSKLYTVTITKSTTTGFVTSIAVALQTATPTT